MTPPSEPVFASFVTLLIDTLAKMVPANSDDPTALAARAGIARLLFDAFKPGDALEAVLAARAVAAHHAAMDSFERAAQPDISHVDTIRLRNTANAACRAFDAVLRTLEKLRKEPRQPQPDAANTATAAPRQAHATQPAKPSPKPSHARSEPPLQIPGLRPASVQTRADYLNSTALVSTRPSEAAANPGAGLVPMTVAVPPSGDHPAPRM